MNLLFIFLSFSSFVASAYTDMIRCYCNLDECVPNNYTCSFKGGGCFSDFLDYSDINNAKHGCLDLLDRNRQDLCGNAPGSTGSPKSLLLCCQTDMCNHLLSPAAAEISRTLLDSLMNSTDSYNVHTNQPYNMNEVWFKAATIAVPICGAMILIMKVIIAFKILRADRVTKYEQPSHSTSATNKDLPLLYDTWNSENLKTTAKRIHYGQNVNVLKQGTEVRYDKNKEFEKQNSQREDEVLDVRVETQLDLDKYVEDSPCNIFKSSSTESCSDIKIVHKNNICSIALFDK